MRATVRFREVASSPHRVDEVIAGADTFHRPRQRVRVEQVAADELGSGRHPTLQLVRPPYQTAQRHSAFFEYSSEPTSHVARRPGQQDRFHASLFASAGRYRSTYRFSGILRAVFCELMYRMRPKISRSGAHGRS